MKTTIALLLMMSSLAYADACKSKADASEALFNRGNAAFKSQDYSTAISYLRRSAEGYRDVSAGICTDERSLQMAGNLGTLLGDIHIVECVSRKYSTDIAELKECYDIPQLESYLKTRVRELTRQSKGENVQFTPAPADPQFDGAAAPRSIYAATVQCRSDQPGRGAPKSCVQSPVDLGNGKWRFKLASGCSNYGYRATIATHDDSGNCVRHVIAFERNGSSEIANTGAAPYVLDVIVINRGEDRGSDRSSNMSMCYQDRQDGGTCN